MDKLGKNKTTRVIVAMSGGVDSSVSAALLKETGFDAAGIFIKCWDEKEFKTGVCTAQEDEKWARRAAAKIGIPFYSIDLVKEYKKRVVDYLIEGYGAGITPNPDVMCNREIKFGLFYDAVINKFGADYLATGHYARMRSGQSEGSGNGGLLRSISFPLILGAQASASEVRTVLPPSGDHAKTVLKSAGRKYSARPLSQAYSPRLFKGFDPNKDQSYFLWAVDSEKFKRVMFPVGGYKKSKVRELARKFNLPNAERKDSQGVCFIGELNINEFLKDYIPNKPGDIIDLKGNKVGEHKGLHFYTIGQRRGVGVGGGPPYYVAKKDFSNNALVVAREFDDDLFFVSLRAGDLNWMRGEPKFPLKCSAKIRYRQEDQKCEVQRGEQEGEIIVEFKKPQRAVTAGQSVVFYKKDELIGGGVIL